jgi:hypothetical protein
MSLDPARLIFVVGPPRGGTTLLSRLLHANSAIYAGPEPHLLPPLAHLGAFDTVQRAPYDPIQTARGQRAFVATLPRGEDDYVDALRALTDTLYGRLLAAHGAARIVDKTPANALVLPFLTRLYPDARYVVLTRHPFAVWVSYARAFFDDDWGVAHAHQPLLERYVPAIGAFLRERPARHTYALTYEALVRDPEAALRPLHDWLEVPFDPAQIRYGDAPPPPAGLGDPVRVDRAGAPDPTGERAWAALVADRPDRLAMLARMARHLDDEDLAAWGTPREALWRPIAEASPRRVRLPVDRHHLQRRLLVAVRRNVHHNGIGRALKAARFALDVLLRE